MKRITRGIAFHVYKFGKIDVQAGTVSMTESVERLDPMSRRDLSKYCAAHDCVLVCEEQVTRMYSLPVTKFIEAAESYAAEAEQNK